MKKILVVDDELALGLLYEEELSGEGYEVVAVSDAESAVEALAREPFDLIVTDLRMPGRDGIGLIGQVVAAQPHIPIIINTAYQSYKQDFMTWAAEAYIVKSSSLDELKTKIKEILSP